MGVTDDRVRAMAERATRQVRRGGLDYVDYLDFKDKLGLLTANATTPYSIAFINLAKTGPLVVKIPAGAIAGGILDFWQRPITDTGALGPEKSGTVFVDSDIVAR